MTRGLSVAALGGALTLIVALVGAVFAVEDRYVSEPEMVEVEKQVAGNTLLILYTQLDRAQFQAREFEKRGQSVPRALIDQINRLCRQIRSLGGQC